MSITSIGGVASAYTLDTIPPKTFPGPLVTPPAGLVVPFIDNPYFQNGNVTFTNNTVTKSGGACDYTTVPVQP